MRIISLKEGLNPYHFSYSFLFYSRINIEGRREDETHNHHLVDSIDHRSLLNRSPKASLHLDPSHKTETVINRILNPIHLNRNPTSFLIMTDDQGYWDTSISGNPHLKTPAMDRIANEGFNFGVTMLHRYAPTRAGLMTVDITSGPAEQHAIRWRYTRC